MRASLLHEDLHRLQVESVNKPLPQGDELLIKVKLVALNPHDCKMRDNGLFIKKYPAILGADITGVVEGIGSRTSGFRIGQRIVCQGSVFDSRKAGCQEYAVLRAVDAVPIPDDVSDEEAVTYPTNLAAIFYSWYSQKNGFGFKPFWETNTNNNVQNQAEGILVIGGTSHTGRLALQLARLQGLHPIVTTATLDKAGNTEKELLKLGATHVIDRHATTEEIVGQIRSVVGDNLIYAFDPVTSIYDGTSTHALSQLSLSNSRSGGKVITLLRVEDQSTWPKKPVDYETKFIIGVAETNPELAPKLTQQFSLWLKNRTLVSSQWEIAGGLEDIDTILDKIRDEQPKKRQIVNVEAESAKI